jgi:hypothetical protein
MFAIRFGAAIAAAAAASACAAGGPSLPAAELEAYVLARAPTDKLATALVNNLSQIQPGDPRRASVEASLRGLLEASAKAEPPIKFASAHFALLAAPAAPSGFASLVTTPGFKFAALEAQAPAAAPAKPSVFAVVLGRFDDAGMAGSVWRELAGADPLAVKGLSARLAPIKGGGVTLVAGPLSDQDTAAGRCTAFSALGMACTPGAFDGAPLSGGGTNG